MPSDSSASQTDHFLPVGGDGPTYDEDGPPRRWLSSALETLRDRGEAALTPLSVDALWSAWAGTVDAFLDPVSEERRALGDRLETGCALSPDGLQAGLDTVLRGVRGKDTRKLFERGAERAAERSAPLGPLAVFLAGNLPALAVQPLLAALAVRRSVLLKSPSREPHFTPAFCTALTRREPRLAPALAALTWRGGDRDMESLVLRRCGKVVVYGDAETVRDLQVRCALPLVSYGPKLSLAGLGRDVAEKDVADGLARDIALFDQRGCLSIHAIFTAGNPETLALALTEALRERARHWPAGTASVAQLAAVRQLRAEAELRGLPPFRSWALQELPLRDGTVVVMPDRNLEVSPGLRTVRIYSIEGLDELPAVLTSWQGQIQGVALAGREPADLRERLVALGVSRCAAPGELQRPDAEWHNGGIDPLDAAG